MLINDQFHLSYCTNIHPGENWKDTFNNLKLYLPEIKKNVSPDTPFGVGLRLSNLASEELSIGNRLKDFKKWLDDNDFYVYTMNGFPYGNFHFREVKDFVHVPDWTTAERLDYTLRLFDQLAFLLPGGITGGISTSPISYKHWHTSEEIQEKSFKKASRQLAKVIIHLYETELNTGKYMHLDIEPEPDGLLENSFEVIDFFREYLIPVATEYLSKHLDKTNDEAEKMIFRYINICYDVCHFSLAYESPQKTFKRFKQTGIKVGKIQISSALKVKFNGEDDEKKLKELSRFNEPTYLHQVTEQKGDRVVTYSDLPVVLNKPLKAKELRAHFHVPIFVESFGLLESTQDQILETLKYLRKHGNECEHLEVESYTWEVLPKELKINLSESIQRELIWVKNNFLSVYEEDCSS